MLVLVGLRPLEQRLLREAPPRARNAARADRACRSSDSRSSSSEQGVHVFARRTFEHDTDRTFELELVGATKQFDVLVDALRARQGRRQHHHAIDATRLLVVDLAATSKNWALTPEGERRISRRSAARVAHSRRRRADELRRRRAAAAERRSDGGDSRRRGLLRVRHSARALRRGAPSCAGCTPRRPASAPRSIPRWSPATWCSRTRRASTPFRSPSTWWPACSIFCADSTIVDRPAAPHGVEQDAVRAHGFGAARDGHGARADRRRRRDRRRRGRATDARWARAAPGVRRRVELGSAAGVRARGGAGRSSTPSCRATTSIVLAAPLTAETRAACSTAERLDLLPRSAIVVNVARGALLDEEALAERLRGRTAARRGARRISRGATGDVQPAVAASAGSAQPARLAGFAGTILAPATGSISRQLAPILEREAPAKRRRQAEPDTEDGKDHQGGRRPRRVGPAHQGGRRVSRADSSASSSPLTKQALTPEQTRAIALHLMSNEDDKARIDKILDYDCSWSAAGIGRFRVNIMKQRGSFSIIMRVIPWEVPTFEKLGLPPVLAKIAERRTRHGARHRRDGLRQVEHDGGADQLHQLAREPPHPHAREPDRVPAPRQPVVDHAARDRLGHDRLQDGTARRAASGSRRHHDRRDARRRDGRHGDQGGGDGPPADVDAAHAGRAEHDPPHHGHVPAGGAGRHPHPAGRIAVRGDFAAPAAQDGRARAARWRRRS